VGKSWYNVCFGGLLPYPWYVHIAGVGRPNCGSVWQRYCDWIGVNFFIDYMGTIANEVAGGSRVAEGRCVVAVVLWFRWLNGLLVVIVISESSKVVTVVSTNGGVRG
jgi:hypothetical protein